jgi:formamidopyrimidine-DNA glycosylase
MPELPEVEHARKLVHAHCVNKICTNVIFPSAETGVLDEKCFKDIGEEMFKKAVLNKRLLNTYRKGKQGWLEFEGESFVLFHFGMTGAFSVKGERPLKYVEFKVDQESWPPKFYKFVLEFSGGEKCLAYTDPRRFGRVQVRNECPRKSAPVNKLGFDPYLERISETEFEKIFRRRNAAIKSVLLDQSVACGVGNWMADEMLYRAKIHPEVKASELNGEAMRSLREAMFDVTRVAVESDADSGRFPSDWLFHHRWGKNQNAKMANGEKISFCEVGGRTTAFVAARQKKVANTTSGSNGADPKEAKKKTTTTTKVKREEEPVSAKKEIAKRSKKASGGGGGGGGATANLAARVTRSAIKSAYFLLR